MNKQFEVGTWVVVKGGPPIFGENVRYVTKINDSKNFSDDGIKSLLQASDYCRYTSYRALTTNELIKNLEDQVKNYYNAMDNKELIAKWRPPGQLSDEQFMELYCKEFNIIKNSMLEIKAPQHYNNDKGSLYQFAEDHKLNSWEFDLVKRLVRCRKKGNFKEDLEKSKFLIDLYLKEQGHLYENEKINP